MLNHWRFSLCSMIVTSVVLAAEWTTAADTPIGPAWWPSRWGAADEAGASNWMTPEKVRSAVTLVKTGKTYRLGRDYEAGMPLFGARVFALRIPGAPPADHSATTRSSGTTSFWQRRSGRSAPNSMVSATSVWRQASRATRPPCASTTA